LGPENPNQSKTGTIKNPPPKPVKDAPTPTPNPISTNIHHDK